MKTILVILISLFTQSVLALVNCGDGIEDRRYPELDWIKATDYKAESVYLNLHGTLCVGMDRRSNLMKRLHYRDDAGVFVQATTSQLKNQNVSFLRYSDFPLMAQMVSRNVDPLTIKVLQEYKATDYTNYLLSLKFVRNMAKGFSQTDFREMIISARFYQNGRVNVFYGKHENSNNIFDLVTLKITSDLKVSRVHFYDGHKQMKMLDTLSLPKTSR